eukprot:15347979-Ditylum_brightwellii.AAC.1
MPKKVRNTRDVGFCSKFQFKQYTRANDTATPDNNSEDDALRKILPCKEESDATMTTVTAPNKLCE